MIKAEYLFSDVVGPTRVRVRDVPIVSFKRLNDNYRSNGYKIKRQLNENGG